MDIYLTYTSVCVCTHAHMHTRTHAHTRVHTCLRVCIRVACSHGRVHTHACPHGPARVHADAYARACVYVPVRARAYRRTYAVGYASARVRTRVPYPKHYCTDVCALRL